MDDRPLSADRVPTLTEVVELDLPANATADVGPLKDPAAPSERALVEPTPALPPEVDLADEITPPAVALAEALVPPAMADDFVLTGLEAEDAHVVLADADADADAPGAAADAEAEPEAEVRAEAESTSATVAMANQGGVEAALPPVERLAPPPAIDVDAIVAGVLAELMPRIDMLLESRLREALAPALARAADGLIRDTRANLSVAVRDLVQEAVDRALQRRADR